MKRTLALGMALIIAAGSGLCAAADAAASKPASPGIVSIKNSSSGVSLNWQPKKNADGYYVYRRTAKSSFVRIAAVKGASVAKYTDKKAKSNKKYTYALKAYNAGGASAYGRQRSILRVGTPKLTLRNKSDSVKVSWKKISGATKYVVAWKKHSAKKYKTLYKGSKTKAVAGNVGSGETYDFKVKAVIEKTPGAYCAPETSVFLEQPTLHAEEYTDMLGITLEWDGVKNAEGYYIYRSVKNKNSFKKIKTVKTPPVKDITYIDTTCESICSYEYYIVAFNGSHRSAKSNIDSDVYGYFENDDTPLYLTISKGEEYRDINRKIKEYGAEALISWKSSDSKTVSVTATGIITGVKKGKATLTASGEYNGRKRHVYIIVTVK